jgi:hypothetical protein
MSYTRNNKTIVWWLILVVWGLIADTLSQNAMVDALWLWIIWIGAALTLKGILSDRK